MATDAPEEFAALADDAVDDFMSEAASDVEIFATTEGHAATCAPRRSASWRGTRRRTTAS